ncbi:glycoside hydrolase family 19 protein [Sedimentitalea todarodis]|uniref:Glycoside hydrolase family 19 protein n=1 Tax=Sedimentitalea todarodis TaxID=1631240 RepID=A0ABU3V8P0_9RHOB|nr:glycoside hydrolase family 19 protein [Sedimentitalea todarodis]MDU9002546.1 glycoside hydrolase family 19 protein [Sedimentitalea todarodis]
MTIETAIRVCASSSVTATAAFAAWQAVESKLEEIGVNNDRRRASLIGQCAHESARFKTRFENLNYSAAGLWKIFRRHFSSQAETNSFARDPEKIANRVYANRMGNGSRTSGDGWRYRGRGYLQLTGKDNYTRYGTAIGEDLVSNPDRAADPDICWLIGAEYLSRTRRSGRTLLEWADVPDILMVTKGINGGTHGLADREVLTGKAHAELTGNASVAEWQALLLNAGLNPGPIDGLFGSKTEAAREAAEAHFGVNGDALLAVLRGIE